MMRKPTEVTTELPWFLYVTVGVPLLNPDAIQTAEKNCKRKINMSYWFTIPHESVDPLYRFLMKNLPEMYGPDVDPSLRGLAVYLPSSSSDSSDLDSDERDSLRDSLESDLADIMLPNLSQPSNILSNEQIKQLSLDLPACIACSTWFLCYSSVDDGFSLRTVYSNMRGVDSFCLLVIRDAYGMVFGAVLSCPIRITKSFVGDGQSFLFTFKDTFQKFGWSGANGFVMLGNKDSLCIGSSHGRFGLWLDEDLHHGRTQICNTFANGLLTLDEDFLIRAVEVWKFV